MAKIPPADRLSAASAGARDAEARGEDARAGEEWRRYRLIKDASRDPDELLAEGIALSRQAVELASDTNSWARRATPRADART